MKVLLINQYFPPDTSATAVILRDLMTAFAARGHDVTVLCGRPSYDPQERRSWRPLIRERIGRLSVERVGSFAFHRKHLVGRLLNYISFLSLAAIRSVGIRRPDVVIAATDPPLAICIALAAARGRPVVYSLRDLHPDAAVASSMIQRGLVTYLWDVFHTWAMKRASLVVCLGQTMAQRVRDKGVEPDRVTVVEDGAWLPRARPDQNVVDELRGEAEFVAMYAGNLGTAFDWEKLCEVDRQLEGAELLFVGDGANAGRLRDHGVRVEPFRPTLELASVMAAGDAQIVPLRPGMAGYVVPSKLFTAFAHGRPVIAIAPGESEAAKLVQQWGCGIVADPTDSTDITQKIHLLRTDRKSLQLMATRAQEAGRYFERGRLLSRFVELTEDVVEAKRTRGKL